MPQEGALNIIKSIQRIANKHWLPLISTLDRCHIIVSSDVMKKNFIKERKQSRGEPSWYLLNFLRNIARAARLMHECIRQMNMDRILIDEAKRNYIISMTSSLETFYHDLFICILGKDEPLLEEILADIKEKPTLVEIHTFLKDGVSFAEIAASKVTFQSIEVTPDVNSGHEIFSCSSLPCVELPLIDSRR